MIHINENSIKFIMLLLLLLSISCTALDNNSKHTPIYMRKDVSFEDRKAYLLMDMYREIAPWPLCPYANNWFGLTPQERIEQPEAKALLKIN